MIIKKIMRYLCILLGCVFAVFKLSAQTEVELLEGTVSYITSQNVYVKFASTNNLEPGDTLFITKEDVLVPALIINNLSSISCVCSPIAGQVLQVNTKISARIVPIPAMITPVAKDLIDESPVGITKSTDSLTNTKGDIERIQDIRGKFSVSSYSNFSNTPGGNSQRMRYNFAMYADNISGSRFSAETYLNFVHSSETWSDIQENMFNGLKIYNLALKYDMDGKGFAWLGRKINPKLSSVGAIDGLQGEMNFGSISTGAFFGTRPDYLDYGFNFDLLQYGAYLAHERPGKNGSMQTTLAYAEQKNKGQTDRRFAYLQHTNFLLKSLYFFGSAEIDLYKINNGNPESDFSLTNLYLSLRYRPVRKITITGSYNARNNIIYYETYKDIIERLIESEMLQGYRLQINYQPVKYLALGLNGGYRFRKSDPRPSSTIYGYITYTHLPGIGASATLSATFLESSYLNGNIYSLTLNRDIISGKLHAGAGYRVVDYQYINTEKTSLQQMPELNISWYIVKKLILSVYYEGTFESPHSYTRVYANLGYRF